MKPYIKDLLILLFILLCFYVGCNWNKRSSTDISQPNDTVYIKGKETIRVDTVEVKIYVYKPVPVVTYAVDTIVDSTLCDSIREYELNNDTIMIASTVQGKLIKQDVLYKMFNTSTSRVDTLKITTFRPTYAAFVTMQFDSLGYVKPAIGFQYGRKRVSYSGSINTKKEATIGVYYNFAR